MLLNYVVLESNNKKEQELVSKTKQGDKNALSQLVSLYSKRIYHLGLRLTGNEKLPEIYRTVFILRDLHELTTNEASKILRITPSNTKIRLTRSRNFLKNKLEDLAKEEGLI